MSMVQVRRITLDAAEWFNAAMFAVPVGGYRIGGMAFPRAR